MEEDELKGKKIRLIHMQPGDDGKPELSVLPGTVGTCRGIDGAGQLLMSWENGSTLSLLPGVDNYEVLEESKKLKHLKRFNF